MRNIKIEGKVTYKNYENLIITDTDTGEIITKDSRKVDISFEVNHIPTITIEYFVNKIEFDIEVKENKNEE